MEVLINADLKEFKSGKGFGFNVVLSVQEHGPVCQFQINGYRVFPNGIVPPGVRYGKGFFYSAFLVDRDTALMIFKELLRLFPQLEEYITVGLDEAIESMVVSNKSLTQFGFHVAGDKECLK